MQKPDPDDDVFDKEIQEAQAAQRDGKSEAEEDLLKEARTNKRSSILQGIKREICK